MGEELKAPKLEAPDEQEFIREYANGGHVPGIPGFFPIGVRVRIDTRTNTVVSDESPPALSTVEEEEKEQPLQQGQALSETAGSSPQENVTVDTNEPAQGEALPVENILGMLGGN